MSRIFASLENANEALLKIYAKEWHIIARRAAILVRQHNHSVSSLANKPEDKNLSLFSENQQRNPKVFSLPFLKKRKLSKCYHAAFFEFFAAAARTKLVSPDISCVNLRFCLFLLNKT